MAGNIGTAVAIAAITLAAGCSSGTTETTNSAQPSQRFAFRQMMESFDIDVQAAIELAAEVCLLADDADGDYDRTVSQIISEYGASTDVRLVVQNAGLVCPAHRDLRGAAVGRFAD